jgi:hypothetical protein
VSFSRKGTAVNDYRKAFDAITADPRYLKNLDWGEVRPGHPERTVRAHIAEIELSLEALRPERLPLTESAARR